MSQVFKSGDRLVLELGDPADEQPHFGFNFQLMSPLLLGLLAPLMVIHYFEPEALRHVKWLIWGFLLCMFLFCSALFFYTHHFPGKISSLVVDREARSIEIVWRNMMSSASQIVPFEEINALRVRHEVDDAGNTRSVAELVVRSRPPLELPDTISEQQLRPLRAAIGLG